MIIGGINDSWWLATNTNIYNKKNRITIHLDILWQSRLKSLGEIVAVTGDGSNVGGGG